jgi:hypothetical protein
MSKPAPPILCPKCETLLSAGPCALSYEQVRSLMGRLNQARRTPGNRRGGRPKKKIQLLEDFPCNPNQLVVK